MNISDDTSHKIGGMKLHEQEVLEETYDAYLKEYVILYTEDRGIYTYTALLQLN
jgi:hypothetical protein